MSKPHIISAGILLESNGKYLIGGTSSKLDSKHGWGIPKGKIEKDETILEAALREFEEETSLDLKKTKVSLGKAPIRILRYKIKGGTKEVHVFGAEDLTGKLQDFEFKCKTFTEKGNPELASFCWLTKKEAKDKVMKSQKELFE